MGADSTLVTAAFKEAISRAGVDVPNLKPLYESNVKIGKGYLDIVTGALDEFKKDEEALRIGKENQLSGFKEIMNNNYKKLFEGKETMPQEVVDAVDAEVRRLQDEFEAVNTYGKGDTVENERARMRISGELKKIINQAIDARATFGVLGQDTKTWNDGAIKGDVEAMKRMFNLDTIDKDDNVSVYFDDNHKLTFRVIDHIKRGGFGKDGFYQETVGDVSYNMDQLRKNIPEANLKADAAILKTLNSVEEQAKKAGEVGVNNWSEDEINIIFAKQIQTKEDFTNLAFRRLDDIDEQSFKTNLMENMDIAISTMNVTFQNMFKSMDVVDDGKINSEDFEKHADKALFKMNYKKMIDVLTDVDNDNFNLDRSKNLLAEYFTGFAEQKYESSYDAAYEEANPTINPKNIIGNYKIGGARGVYDPTGGPLGTGFRSVGWKNNQQLNVNAQIIKMKKGQTFKDYLGNTWRMGGSGKITGFYAGTNNPIYKWDDKLNDGDGGYSNKLKTFTEKEALDMLFGMGEQNLG